MKTINYNLLIILKNKFHSFLNSYSLYHLLLEEEAISHPTGFITKRFETVIILILGYLLTFLLTSNLIYTFKDYNYFNSILK